MERQKERLKDADVLMLANMPLGQEVVEACECLKFIDVAFTGVDHIPVAAAGERGLPSATRPDILMNPWRSWCWA